MNGGRDRGLERSLLEAIVRTAKRQFGVDCRPYIGVVETRMAIGAERYGDDAFLERDNLVELLEETPDVAGYALLELQRLGPGATDGVRHDLLRAALCGAVADFYARRAARRMSELEVEELERGARLEAPA